MVFEAADELLARVDAGDAFVVSQFYDGADILELRNRVFARGQTTPPSWHPLVDGCPDYHRLHDNYPQAHVRSKMHGFYHHGFHPANDGLFAAFGEIFAIKNHLAGAPHDRHLRAVPSSGTVARVNLQHYPRGGGYIAEHRDPAAEYARVQTLIQASRPGVDFTTGGLFACAGDGAAPFAIDPLTEPGDLIVMSPAIRHGVAPIHPDEPYAWTENSGKWTVIPIILASDMAAGPVERPRPV